MSNVDEPLVAVVVVVGVAVEDDELESFLVEVDISSFCGFKKSLFVAVSVVSKRFSSISFK